MKATPKTRLIPRLPVILGCVWLLAVACVNLVPRQGWSPDRGAVVPHDSFPGDCSLCHTGGDWHTIRSDFEYDHANETGYALHGAHTKAGCLMCHNDRGPVEQFAARGCAGCHADPHFTRLGSNCQDCHEQRTWYPREAIARHDTTRFPLVGAHAAAACFRCHPGAEVGNFAGAPADCRECHASDYANTSNPSHAVAGFSRSCEECHLPTGWRPARFAHPASFPLAQSHFGLSCSACHVTPNVFTGLTGDCADCHTPEYLAATDPNHVAAGFANDCETCHDARSFARSFWPHPPGFELTFGHAGRRCTECHVGETYVATPTDCASCHLDTYQATQNPNHLAVGFGQDCETCHNTARWSGAMVDHPETMPLTNSHQRACNDCHVANNYLGLDPACASCHQAEYNAANDPPHVAFGLSLQCQECHGTTQWGDGNWQHTFPINGGNHGGLLCFDCHNNPGNRLQFSCIDCHEHNQVDMADDHSRVTGYTYTTAACYSCHPTGN